MFNLFRSHYQYGLHAHIWLNLKIFCRRTNRLRALKVGMYNQVEYNQDCLNDNLELILTFFTPWSNMGKILEHRFHGNFVEFGLKLAYTVF